MSRSEKKQASRKRRRTQRRLIAESLETRMLLAADLSLTPALDGPVDDSPVLIASEGEANTDAAQEGEMQERSDVVIEWNDLFGELLVANESNQNPGYASRAMAMLNLAIYDAVTIASGDSENTFYDYDFGADVNARAEVAASQAAYTVLSSLYADQQAMIDAFMEQTMAGFRPGGRTDASLALGAEIGNQILANRADDGSEVIGEYTYVDEIGYFQHDPLNPDVPVWGPAWGEVDTFSIGAAESFAPETTPALTSVEYAESYNEVKELGSVDSEIRTAEETEIGIFWAYDRVGLGTPMALFGDVLESVAREQGNTLEENAAMYAQASVAMADAGIVAWHTKFSEQFWRPVTAIHDGDLDGNPLTEGDTEWTALGAPDGGDDIIGFTPQFPTYISGHATFGGALFGALQEFYGTDDISFEVSSQELEILLEDPELQEAYGLDLDDAARTFDSFSEAMAENGRSRVYLGIHFDFDDLVGQEVGQAVATAVSSEFVVADDPGGPGGGGPGGPGGGGPGGGGPGGGGPGGPGPDGPGNDGGPGGPGGPDNDGGRGRRGPRGGGPGNGGGGDGPGGGPGNNGGPGGPVQVAPLNAPPNDPLGLGDIDAESGALTEVVTDEDLDLLAQDQVERRGNRPARNQSPQNDPAGAQAQDADSERPIRERLARMLLDGLADDGDDPISDNDLQDGLLALQQFFADNRNQNNG